MKADAFGLRERVVLVTGGTRGIGHATAEVFAQAGAHVALTSRKLDDAQAAASRIQKKHAGSVARGFACDVTDNASIADLMKGIRAWSKKPFAAVVNNAGYEIVPKWWATPLHEMSPTEIEKSARTVAAVDLEGARMVTYYALPRFIEQGRGSFVYVSSTPAITGYQGFPYTEAKAAVLGLMRDTARVYGPQGIRANAVAPGNIRTSWLDKVSPKERKKLEKENPLRRFGEPQEVANTILFLASDLASFVNGETIIVDGGTVIR